MLFQQNFPKNVTEYLDYVFSLQRAKAAANLSPSEGCHLPKLGTNSTKKKKKKGNLLPSSMSTEQPLEEENTKITTTNT